MGVIHGVIKPVLPVTDGLWGWFDAGQGVTKDGAGLVSEWKDMSGNGQSFYKQVHRRTNLYNSLGWHHHFKQSWGLNVLMGGVL